MTKHGRILTAALLVSAAAGVLSSTATAATETETFAYTGAAQTWTVPPGVTEATFDLYGAQGGGGGATSDNAAGLGGRATATITLTPGASIEVNVGGSGGGLGVEGGFNGGGTSYGNDGGGASDIRVGGTAPADRALVAGGGGGAGLSWCVGLSVHGGAGGGSTGEAGSGGSGGCGAPVGGGGTQTEGGSATAPATAGGFGTGGSGGISGGGAGGGGGGGWFGGGGGSGANNVGGGGGGGSGYGPPGTVFETGVRSGDGLVTVSYELGPAPLTTITSGPEGVSTNASPSFAFESDQPGSSLECSLDAVAFSTCASPQGYSELADGQHTFAVRATNDQLTTGTPATRDFTIDTSTAGSASAKAKQRQAKNEVVIKLKVGASDEPLKAKAKGKVKLGRKGFKLAPRTMDLDAGATQAVKLKPKKDQDRLLKGLANGKSATAKLQVKFTDSVGNAAVEKLQVTLTGR